MSCGRRYTTFERREELILRVIKKNGIREPFNRNKILSGLAKASEKRPVSMDQLENIISLIERELYDKFEREVPSRKIGEIVMRELKKLDKVAYVRFASVYREFKDVNEFLNELKPILEK